MNVRHMEKMLKQNPNNNNNLKTTEKKTKCIGLKRMIETEDET